MTYLKSIPFILLFCFQAPSLILSQTDTASQGDHNRAMVYFMEGLNDIENQDFERALDNLIAAHLILSDDPGINYALSDVYFAIRDYSNAAYYGQTASELDPGNKWYKIHLVNIQRASGRGLLAVELLEELIEQYPSDQDLLYTLSEIYIENGNLLQSNLVLDRIIDTRGSSFELHLRKFQNYNLLNDYENALNELHAMRASDPGNVGTLQLIAQYYIELDEPDMAIEMLEEASDRSSGDIRTQLLLAEIYINAEEWERLGDTFVNIISDPLISPAEKLELVRFMASQNGRGEMGDLFGEQTSRVITAFSEEEPEFMPAQLLAADYFIMMNELDKALTLLETVTSMDPGNDDAWIQRIQLLFSLEEYEQVIELSDRAPESASGNSMTLFFSGAAYMMLNQYSEAREKLLEAAEYPSQRAFRSIIYGTLGDVSQQLNNWEETMNAMEMALRLNPDNHTVLNNYAYYLSLREERLDQALTMAERAVSMEPFNSAYLDTIGWIHFKLGNLDKAYQYVLSSVETGSASAEVFEHLGDIYEAKGDDDNAVKWWKSAYETDPERIYLPERWEQEN